MSYITLEIVGCCLQIVEEVPQRFSHFSMTDTELSSHIGNAFVCQLCNTNTTTPKTILSYITFFSHHWQVFSIHGNTSLLITSVWSIPLIRDSEYPWKQVWHRPLNTLNIIKICHSVLWVKFKHCVHGTSRGVATLVCCKTCPNYFCNLFWARQFVNKMIENFPVDNLLLLRNSAHNMPNYLY